MIIFLAQILFYFVFTQLKLFSTMDFQWKSKNW